MPLGIYSIALAGCGVEEVHLVASRKVAGAVDHAHEALMLAASSSVWRPSTRMSSWVERGGLRPPGAGQARPGPPRPASPGSRPGRDPLPARSGLHAQSRAELPGRVVLDGIPLVRDALRLEDYRLETVARAVLDRGKLLDQDAPDSAGEITRLYREDPEALVAYNLEDARLVLDILEKEELLGLAVERSLLSGCPWIA